MQIQNNYEKEVFNGDLGRIVRIDPESQEVVIDFDGRRVPYDYADLDEVVLAYAISIHKSQGSEYPAVVIPILTQHYVLLQRNLIYTAVTRGRKLVVLVGGDDWIPQILGALSGVKDPPAILCTGIRGNPEVLGRMIHPTFVGYILKSEISYSLAWAIDYALSGKFVVTEGVRSLASSMRYPLPRPCVVLDGRHTLQSTLSRHQSDVSRLAFLFSMERREHADELGVVEDWGYGLVSQIYEQLGVKDILNDEEVDRTQTGPLLALEWNA